MNLQKTPLIIPVENQLRELDPKLLLACVAAERGFTVVLGSIRDISVKITSFPRSVYLAKSMTSRSIKAFRVLSTLGHEIVVWDEEALVHHSKEQYFGRRLDPNTMAKVSALLAWGKENAELFQEYPDYSGAPVHITGNPRGDMMRPDVLPFYKPETESIRAQFGDFILVNTNFSMVNGFLPSLNLRNRSETNESLSVPGTAARGFSSEFAEGWANHKEAIFEDFKRLVPLLSKRFPNQNIVVRPHPMENHDVWHQLAEPFDNLTVVYKGNVLAWLQAAKAVIHNGCTTGIEAFIVKLPGIAYRPLTSERYDLSLPNSLSHECFTAEDVCQSLEAVLTGEFKSTDTTERRRILHSYIASLDGPLACERIMEVIEQREASRSGLPRPELSSYLKGQVKARIRSFKKVYIKPRLAGHRGNPRFMEQRFPGVSVDEVRARAGRFAENLQRFEDVQVEQLFKNIFKLHT